MDIGLRRETLRAFDIGWDGSAFTFPMRNDRLEIIGIQRRFPDGQKCVVKGSTAGLFMPVNCGLKLKDMLAVCEGLSDTATLYELGIPAIGRFNCNSGKEMIISLVKWLGRPQVILVGDNDEAGRAGMDELGAALTVKGIEHQKVWPTKYNDVREAYVKGNLTKELFYEIVE